MIVVIGLFALIAATVVTRPSVATCSDSTPLLSGNLVSSAPARDYRSARAPRPALTREPSGSGQVPPLVRNTSPSETKAQRRKPFRPSDTQGIVTRGNVSATVPTMPI